MDLSKTKAVNLHEIVQSLNLIKKSKTDFKLKTNKKFELKNPCIKEYGLLNLIRGDFSQSSHNIQDGSLSPCIECDEVMSGAGFKYSAGRTRRNSGIRSAIQRGDHEVYFVEHLY